MLLRLGKIVILVRLLYEILGFIQQSKKLIPTADIQSDDSCQIVIYTGLVYTGADIKAEVLELCEKLRISLKDAGIE